MAFFGTVMTALAATAVITDPSTRIGGDWPLAVVVYLFSALDLFVGIALWRGSR